MPNPTETQQPSVAELQQRIQRLVENNACERGKLAEQLSQLLEENDHLKTQLKAAQWQAQQPLSGAVPASVAVTAPASVHAPLNFDFSIPDESQGKRYKRP